MRRALKASLAPGATTGWSLRASRPRKFAVIVRLYCRAEATISAQFFTLRNDYRTTPNFYYTPSYLVAIVRSRNNQCGGSDSGKRGSGSAVARVAVPLLH